ncbi:hypothetical protein XMM379_003140 [Aliiroseovarius sp. xm-m-379]|nr:hypothetical protein [Aliiroseovarius sp. xm-m-379]
MVHLVLLGDVREFHQSVLVVATLQATRLGHVEVPVDHLHHRIAGLVSAPTRGVDSEHRASEVCGDVSDVHRGIHLVSTHGDVGEVLVLAFLNGTPLQFERGSFEVHRHDDQIAYLQGEPFEVTEGGREHELHREPGFAVGGLTLDQVSIVKTLGIGRLSFVIRELLDVFGQSVTVHLPHLLVWHPSGPDLDLIATIRQLGVQRVLGLRGP